MDDLILAARILRKNPGYSMVAIITLALGVGANTATFSVVRAVLLNQLPYLHPERLVQIAESEGDTPNAITVDFTTTSDLRARSTSFEYLSLYRDGTAAIADGGAAEVLDGKRINFDYFDTLGVKMQLGRRFLPEEDRPARRREVILTHGLWMRRFGGDPQILGRVLHLDADPFTVVGVLPAAFRPLPMPGDTETPAIFTPLGYDLSIPNACRGCQHLRLIGRLKPGISADRARSELNAIMRAIVREHPKDYAANAAIALEPLRDHIVGRVSTALWVLLGAVGFVLLIACANVANLVLARATGRSAEIALRVALGAARWRIVRHLSAESLLLAAAGGISGALLAWWWTYALVSLGPKELPRVQEIRMDGPVLLFGMAAALFTAVLFGLIPALRASRCDLTAALKDLGKSTAGPSRQRLRTLLVAGELALAFVLVTGAGLLGKSFLRLMNVDTGYDAHKVLALNTYVYGPRYQKPEPQLEYYRQAMERVRAIPGIESAAMTSVLPLGDFDRKGFHIQDRRMANPSDVPMADTYSVSPDYFRVMRIALKRGRLFTDADGPAAPRVAVISESCARSQFPGQDPIGRHIQLGGRHEDRPWLTIVGIVGDVRQWSLDRPSDMEAYIVQAQDVTFDYRLVARAAIDPRRLESAVRDAVLSVDKTQPVFHLQPMDEYVSASVADRTFTLTLLALFGGLALVLAAVGIYGVISYAVVLRTREIGIRMAVGARRWDILNLVLRQSLVLVFCGLALGFAASVALTRLLGSLLFEVRPIDLGTSALVALLLALAAIAASYLPASRASKVDPLVALRYE